MATIAAIAAGLLLSFPDSGVSPDTLLAEDRFFGSFEGAYRITIDPRGRIFVVDREASVVHVFSPRFEILQQLGGYGWNATSFDHPTGIASDGLAIFVSDYGNHRISRFDQPLTHVSALFTRDSSYAPARFGFPMGVAISRQGDLYVLDGENSRILKFDHRSNFETSFGGYESGRGKLARPIEIAVSESDRVLVLEPDRIVEFDYTGNYLGSFGESILVDARGFGVSGKGIAAVSSGRVWFFDQTGVLKKSFHVSNIFSESMDALTDVALAGERVFLLTPASVGVFRILRTR